MQFARTVFRVAGIYGLLVLLPQYFFEDRIGRDFPPAITHPELFYGFLGTAATWQLVYLCISREPQRLRGMMLIGVVAKASFGLPALVLYAAGRIAGLVAFFAGIDLALGALFAVSYFKTPEPPARAWES